MGRSGQKNKTVDPQSVQRAEKPQRPALPDPPPSLVKTVAPENEQPEITLATVLDDPMGLLDDPLADELELVYPQMREPAPEPIIELDNSIYDVDYDKPFGPEATDDELKAIIALHHPDADEDSQEFLLSQYRKYLDDESVYRLGPNMEGIPSRRALEAALAAMNGHKFMEWRALAAHRSWSDLVAEAKSVPVSYPNGYEKNAYQMAHKIEDGLRGSRAMDGSPTYERRLRDALSNHRRINVNSEEFEDLVTSKIGLGARTGKIGDYSRAELRKLMGLLERETKDLSDDDLRGMAMADGLVPKHDNAPSHVELALSRSTHPHYFKKAMRSSYKDLIRYQREGLNDDGYLQPAEIVRKMHHEHPLMVASSQYLPVQMRQIAEQGGIDVRAGVTPNKSLLAEGSADEAKGNLEVLYDGAFKGFVERFGGAKKLGRIRSGTKGRRGVYAFYEPASGDVHLNTQLAKHLRSKKASPAEIEQAVSSVAHELWHSIEGRDAGNNSAGSRNTSTPEHTLDEGATEALARIHTQDLAERMGLWDKSQGNLRDHADPGSYPHEVQTALAVAAACVGELDHGKLQSGGYRQPEDLSPKGQQWLEDLHRQHGAAGRIGRIANTLGGPNNVPEVRQILRECKNVKTYSTRQRFVDGKIVGGVDEAAQKLGSKLSEMLAAF